VGVDTRGRLPEDLCGWVVYGNNGQRREQQKHSTRARAREQQQQQQRRGGRERREEATEETRVGCSVVAKTTVDACYLTAISVARIVCLFGFRPGATLTPIRPRNE